MIHGLTKTILLQDQSGVLVYHESEIFYVDIPPCRLIISTVDATLCLDVTEEFEDVFGD